MALLILLESFAWSGPKIIGIWANTGDFSPIASLADEKYICENKAKMEAMLLSVRDNFTLLSDAPEYLQIYFKGKYR